MHRPVRVALSRGATFGLVLWLVGGLQTGARAIRVLVVAALAFGVYTVLIGRLFSRQPPVDRSDP